MQVLSPQNRETLLRLRLITNIKEGEKIDTHYISIQPNTYMTKLYRYLYSESLSNTVVFLRNTVNQSIALWTAEKDPKKKADIQSDLKNAELGLIALSESYHTDMRIVSELESIVAIISRSLP